MTIKQIQKIIFTSFYSLLLFVFSASTVFAQPSTSGVCSLRGVANFKDLVQSLVGCFLRPAVYIIIGMSIVSFLWGVFKLFIVDADGKDKSAAKNFAFWGIVGIFVMVSLWGLVNVLSRTFDLGTDITPRPINLKL